MSIMNVSKSFLSVMLLSAITLPIIVSCSNDDAAYDPTEEFKYEYEVEPNSLQTYTIPQLLDLIPEILSEGLSGIEIPQIPGLPADLSEMQIEDLLPVLKLLIGGIDNIEEAIYDSTVYSTCVFKYKSIDTKGQPVWLSGRLYFMRDRQGGFIEPDHIVLANHHTICTNKQAPSSGLNIEAALAHNKGLVVVPDYIGYGETVDLVHPYCIPDITARNTLDMVRAARQYFKDNGIKNIGALPFYNEGYSQGGSSALAVAKFVQTDAQASKEFKLANTYCGGGPYCMPRIYQTYVSSNINPYPIVIPMIMIGFKDCFPDLINLDLDAYFSDAINKAGIIDYIKSKEYDDYQLMDTITKIIEPLPASGIEVGITVKTSDVLSAEALREGSEIYNNILAATELCDLTTNWIPQSNIHFMHSTHDEWVGYYNFEEAQKQFGNIPNVYFESIDRSTEVLGKHLLTGVTFYARAICGEYMNVYE